jgi:hypothetical protein
MRARVIDTEKQAEKTVTTFYDRAPRVQVDLPFWWPEQMQEVGEGKAEMYRSNKWQKDFRTFDDYKHVVEKTRTVYAEPGFLVEWQKPHRPMRLHGPMMRFDGPMPKHFAELGPLLGVQLQLYDEKEELQKKGFFEVRIARAKLGAAIHPDTNETFLFVYTPAGVHLILTGDQLSIEKDGIAG